MGVWAQKAGHAGTLDPDATGVLAVALGEATKTVPMLMEALKCYRFRVTFGAATSTDDAAGTVIATSSLRPDGCPDRRRPARLSRRDRAGAATGLGRQGGWRARL
jgi:hypothetical protein